MSVPSGRRVELWVESRGGAPAVNPVMRALLDDLAASGSEVAIRVPEQEVTDPSRSPTHRVPDLVLLKSATNLALSLAVADESLGVRFLNGARTTLRTHDKAAAVSRLAAAGLPVPETLLADPRANGKSAPPDSSNGWVTKPTRGVHGRGVAVHAAFPEALDEAVLDASGYVMDDGTRLIQRRIGGEEADVKVYVAGESVFAGTKTFGPGSYASDDVSPVTLPSEIQEMVRAAGEALDLRLFGLDLRFEGDAPVIIDANPFPGYRGFPEAVDALRAEVERALEER